MADQKAIINDGGGSRLITASDTMVDGSGLPFVTQGTADAPTGSMYMSTASDTQSILTAVVDAVVVMNSTNIQDGVTVTPAIAELEILESGRYLVSYDATVAGDANNLTITFVLELNGTPISATEMEVFIKTSGDVIPIGFAAPVDLIVSDNLVLNISHNSGSTRIITYTSIVFNATKQVGTGTPGTTGVETKKDNFQVVAESTTLDFKGGILITDDTGGVTGIALNTRGLVTITDANHTAVLSNNVILFSTGNVDRILTLPTASSATNVVYTIKKIDSGTGKIIVDGDTAETIDGVITRDIINQYDAISIISDGTEWWIY